MRSRRRSQGDVELNLAAMLDMAFQLLAFFILTFKPAPVEGQVNLRMPPPQPVTNVNAGSAAGADVSNQDVLKGMNTLVISIFSTDSGQIQALSVGDPSQGGVGPSVRALEARLSAVLGDPSTTFDQVIINVDPRLQYSELMQVIDICTRQKLPNGEKLTKLSFVEMPSG